MKSYKHAIKIVNAILFLFFCWLLWIGSFHLPGQLNSKMQIDVMLQKYEVVCARLTVSLTLSCLVVLVIVNAILIRAYFRLKKNMGEG
jgi:hypothetical protein